LTETPRERGYTAGMTRRPGGWARFAAMAGLALMLLVQEGFGWGREGHMLINRLAVEALPRDVPEFLRSAAAQDAMEYYGPEPDRWRSPTEPELNVAAAPEHFLDMEWADLVGTPLPRRRYDFVRALAYAQTAHPELPLTPEKVGLQPYATDEGYERLKAAMREYRTLSAQHKDVQPVEGEILYLAGILGHYIADGSQPLHTSVQYNGWTGANPHGYTTLHTIHSQFETTFVKASVRPSDVRRLVPQAPVVIDDVFTQYVQYLRKSNSLVDETYLLEKSGGFEGTGNAQSRAFADERLAAGVTELRDVIYTAWIKSADPIPAHRY
jgi:hypothetical protein